MPEAFDRITHLLKVGMVTRFKPHKIQRGCDFCGEEYERIPSKIGRFCSYGCSNKALAPQQTETRQGLPLKGQKVECEQCGALFYAPICRINGEIGKNGYSQNRRYCSNKCRQLASRKPNELKRNHTRLKIWRMAILERDNFTCVLCDETDVNLLQATHIKPREQYPNEQYDLDNGRTLCLKCHSEESPARLRNLILSFAERGEAITFQVCDICGKQFHRKPSQSGKYCSQACYHKSRKGLPAWNTGKSMKEQVYA